MKTETRHISVSQIASSPYQHRKYFNEEKLIELAASIQREGLIQPILARPKNGVYELIAGERRLRAVKNYTDMDRILCRVVDADDLQARRMSAAENLLREDLSAIETIEAIVKMVDAELLEYSDYEDMGKTSFDRVKAVLTTIDSAGRSLARGFRPKDAARETSNRFIRRIEEIFKNLPKPVDWQSFFKNDLPLLRVSSAEIREISDQQGLNKSQIRALIKLKAASDEAFHEIVGIKREQTVAADARPSISHRGVGPYGPEADRCQFPFTDSLDIRDLSAREIGEVADKIVQKEIREERSRKRFSPGLDLDTRILSMTLLGIPVDRIASSLEIQLESASKHSGSAEGAMQDVIASLEDGASVREVAEKHDCPEPLVWSIALEAKSDQERFKLLKWGLRTWDNWYFADVDMRFGDDWPGRIPAQLVAHTLFYYTREGDLVFDPMAGGGVVPDVCLAFHRRCWSFDLNHRPETRPEIESFRWDPENLLWPVKEGEEPDLIFFDAPYFKKMAAGYGEDSISNLSRVEYLDFFRDFFILARERVNSGAHIAFLNADWRDFQGTPACEEDPEPAILLFDYINLLASAGWAITHLIDCPLSTQRFHPNVVKRMQKNRTLGTVRRSLIMARML